MRCHASGHSVLIKSATLILCCPQPEEVGLLLHNGGRKNTYGAQGVHRGIQLLTEWKCAATLTWKGLVTKDSVSLEMKIWATPPSQQGPQGPHDQCNSQERGIWDGYRRRDAEYQSGSSNRLMWWVCSSPKWLLSSEFPFRNSPTGTMGQWLPR